jgi:hypothetical protein
MLAAHPHHIATALAGIEQQRKRKPRLAARRMFLFESLDLGVGPAMEAVRFYPNRLHRESRIISANAGFNRMLHKKPQQLAKPVGCRRFALSHELD